MRSKTSSALVLGLGVSLGLCLTAGPAAARWTIHDDAATGTIAPPGGTDVQACSEGVRAESGWVGDLDTPGAFDAAHYQVWRAPAGFDTFDANRLPPGETVTYVVVNHHVTDYIFTDSTGEHHADLVASEPAPPRRLLTPPEVTQDGNLVVAKSAFYADLDSSVAVGDVLGLRPESDDTLDSLIDLSVVDCSFSAQSGQYSARTGQRVTLNLGRITGPGGPADYSAKIAWGDGSGNSTGVVRQSGGALVVAGTHRYGHRGDYAVHVTVKQLYTGTKHTATGQVRVRN
jgi:hypothetical protein